MTLRTQLDDLAAAAPGPDALDLDRLRGRIIRRRRGRLAAAAGAALLTVAAIGTAAATLLPGTDTTAEPPIATPAPVQQAFTTLGCGWTMKTHGPAPAAPLQMTVDLDESVDSTDWEDPIGTATVTNLSDVQFHGTTSQFPDTYMVNGGAVITEPGPQRTVGVSVDLAPGESVTYPVHSFLRQCTPGETTQPRHEPLEPGTYQVYIDLQFSDAFTLYSGPIDLEVE